MATHTINVSAGSPNPLRINITQGAAADTVEIIFNTVEVVSASNVFKIRFHHPNSFGADMIEVPVTYDAGLKKFTWNIDPLHVAEFGYRVLSVVELDASTLVETAFHPTAKKIAVSVVPNEPDVIYETVKAWVDSIKDAKMYADTTFYFHNLITAILNVVYTSTTVAEADPLLLEGMYYVVLIPDAFEVYQRTALGSTLVNSYPSNELMQQSIDAAAASAVAAAASAATAAVSASAAATSAALAETLFTSVEAVHAQAIAVLGISSTYISYTTADPIDASVVGTRGARLDTDGSWLLLTWDGADWQVDGPTALGESGTRTSTLATLKLVREPLSNRLIYMEGHTAKDDAGEGNFVWDPASAAVADDVLVVARTGHVGNGRWLRCWDQLTYNLGWYGVDNTGVVDNATELQLAFSDMITAAIASTTGGFSLYVPKGTFKSIGTFWDATGHTDTSGNWSIYGAGSQHSKVLYTPAAVDDPGFDLSQTLHHFQVRGLKLESATSGEGHIMLLGDTGAGDDITRCNFNDLHIRRGLIGVEISSAWIVNFNDCDFRYNAQIVVVTGAANQIGFIGCNFENYDNVFVGGGHISFEACTLEGENDAAAIALKFTSGVLYAGNCYFEHANDDAAYFDVGYDAGEWVVAITFVGNIYAGFDNLGVVDRCSLVNVDTPPGAIKYGPYVKQITGQHFVPTFVWGAGSNNQFPFLTMPGPRSPFHSREPVWETDLTDLDVGAGVTFPGPVTGLSDTKDLDDLGYVKVITRDCQISMQTTEVEAGRGANPDGREHLQVEILLGQEGLFTAEIIFRLQAEIFDMIKTRDACIEVILNQPSDCTRMLATADINYDDALDAAQQVTVVSQNPSVGYYDKVEDLWSYRFLAMDLEAWWTIVDSDYNRTNYLTFKLQFHNVADGASTDGRKFQIAGIKLWDTLYPLAAQKTHSKVYGQPSVLSRPDNLLLWDTDTSTWKKAALASGVLTWS